MKTQKTIQAYLEKWTYSMGLRWWKVDAYYLTGKDAKKEFGELDNNHHIVARSFADWRYLEASIYFNMPEMRKLSNEQIENTVIHELCHVLVNEMREGALHHEERVVTCLSRAFKWTHENSSE